MPVARPLSDCSVALGIALVLIVSQAVWAADNKLQRFSDVTLIESAYFDGDSFQARAGATNLHLRLYFVDCPETEVSDKTDAVRIRAQARYFGIRTADGRVDVRQMTEFGKQAAQFTRQSLGKPFTVHTAFANAGGRSVERRVYAFVTTADGRDLAGILVQNGLARAVGVGRASPDRVPMKEMAAKLRDLEASAMLKRSGIWAKTDPDGIAELRAAERADSDELDKLRQLTR